MSDHYNLQRNGINLGSVSWFCCLNTSCRLKTFSFFKELLKLFFSCSIEFSHLNVSIVFFQIRVMHQEMCFVVVQVFGQGAGSTFLSTPLPHELCQSFSIREINYEIVKGKLECMQTICACK